MRSTKTSSNPDRGAHPRPALFLDRDGTINTEVDFLRSPDEVQLIPGAADAIRDANTLGVPVVVITNQSGIARGYLTETDLAAVHDRLRALLAAHGARVDGIYYCPHHPSAGVPPYGIACDCRKPNPGMLLRAAKDLHLDLSRSVLIGDRCGDIEAGQRAGCSTVLVLTGYGATEQQECRERLKKATIAQDLREAWKMVGHDLVDKE